MRYVLSILIIILTTLSARSEDVVTLVGESTYYDDGSHTKNDCCRLAAEQARIEALAKKFGTIVTQDLVQTDRIQDGREHNDFLALSNTEVRGEWLGDEGKPTYEISLGADGNLVVRCRVRGKARAISNESAAFESYICRNVPDKQCADTHFVDQDNLYLYFNGSCDGDLSMFLEDENNTVYLLLPYPQSTRMSVRVKKNTEYYFFSKAKRGEQVDKVEEFVFTAPTHLEYNRAYVVFSPNPYSRPTMSMSGGGIPSTSSKEFHKWLTQAQSRDRKMNVNAMNIEITPKDQYLGRK